MESNDTASLEVLEWRQDGRSIAFELDEQLYPLEAIQGAAYLFLDRCFLFFRRPADQRVEVILKTKTAPTTPETLENLAGEFGNALLDQVVRHKVSESTGKIREYYMARAFLSAPAQSSIDQLLAELDAEELAGDALQIPVPWEQGS
jgi:His-Xaa-Ser system protein HxsD